MDDGVQNEMVLVRKQRGFLRFGWTVLDATFELKVGSGDRKDSSLGHFTEQVAGWF